MSEAMIILTGVRLRGRGCNASSWMLLTEAWPDAMDILRVFVAALCRRGAPGAPMSK